MSSKFHFFTKIAAILPVSEEEWLIEFDDFKTKSFTFVIVCCGLVSTNPNIIKIAGNTLFEANGGTIIHSSQRRSNDIFKGKNVMVIGNGKSAVDAAAAAAEVAKENGTKPPIQLARRQTWYVPRYILGLIQYKWAFHSRIGSALLPRYFETTSLFLRLLHFLLTPVKWFMWRLVEIILLMQFRLPYRIWPKMGTVSQAALENSVLITDECHLRRLRKGEIDMRIGTVDRLQPGKAVLSDGRVEDVDVIVLATGWKLAFELFMDGDSIFSGLDYSKDGLDFCGDGLWLYRNILPCGFKGMAFVGSNTLTFMNIYTSYIQAYWLAQLLAGGRRWPEEDHMKQTVEREKVFKRKLYPECDMRGSSIELYMQHYHDVLFREMKARKPFNCLIRPIADLIIPVLPSTMKGCLEPEPKMGETKKGSSEAKSKKKDGKSALAVDKSDKTASSSNSDKQSSHSENSANERRSSSDNISVHSTDLWIKNCEGANETVAEA